jgi:PKD repeat protein
MGLDVDFVAGRTGGVGPFTYLWDFGDAGSGVLNTSSLENPSHTYTTPGRKVVTLTITDTTCNCSVTTTLYVYVIYTTCDCVDYPDGVPAYFDFVVSGGTGDFATANGTWRVYHTQACGYQGDLKGWTASLGLGMTLTLTGPDGQTVTWDTTFSSGGCTATTSFASSVGTGTPPDVDGNALGGLPSCGPCCDTPYTTGECCAFGDGDTLTANFATTIPGVAASYSLTYDAGAGQFKYDDATPGARVASIRFNCVDGVWTLAVTGVCDDLVTPFGFTIAESPDCCGPFRWTGTTTSEDGCYNGTLVTATVGS